jgi:hypothetical protein
LIVPVGPAESPPVAALPDSLDEPLVGSTAVASAALDEAASSSSSSPPQAAIAVAATKTMAIARLRMCRRRPLESGLR